MKLDILSSQFQIRWNWVKGHSGDKYNEEVDRLARDQINFLHQIDFITFSALLKSSPGPFSLNILIIFPSSIIIANLDNLFPKPTIDKSVESQILSLN